MCLGAYRVSMEEKKKIDHSESFRHYAVKIRTEVRVLKL